jgi:hemerythrin-like metal-binding protein
MKEHGFPGIIEHRAAHKHYIRKVAYFNHLYDDINPTKPEDVSDFLKEWWINHIMQMDMDYKKFVENNNNGKQG